MTINKQMIEAELRRRQAGLGPSPRPAPAPQQPAMSFSDHLWQRQLQQESGRRQFNRQGQPLTSPAGAVGIAQVMPQTGPEAARLAGLPWDEQRFRTDAQYNEALGRAYQEHQLRQFGDPALALAAYNAGPGRVQEWIQRFGNPATGEISREEFVQSIPFEETRNYVQNILGENLAAPAKPSREAVLRELKRRQAAAQRPLTAPEPAPVPTPAPTPLGLEGTPGAVAGAVRDAVTAPPMTPERRARVESNLLEPGMRGSMQNQGEGFWRFLTEEGLQTAGGVGGALAGGALGAPLGLPGIVGGAVLGAFGGGAIGGGVNDAIQQALADPSVPPDLKQSLQAALQSGSEEAIMETLGRVISIVPGIARNLRSQIKPDAAEADKFLRAEGGMGLTPGQLGDSWAVKFAESAISGAPIGGARFNLVTASNIEALQKATSDMLDRVAGEGVSKMTRADVGNMVLDVIDEGKKALSVIDAELYKAVGDLMPNTVTQTIVKKPHPSGMLDSRGNPMMVDTVEEVVTGPVQTKAIKAWAERTKDKISKVKTGASSDIANMLDDIINLPPDAPLETVSLLRSRVGELNRALQRQAGTGQNRYLLSAAEAQITRAIEDAAERMGPEAAEALKMANSFHKKSKSKLLDDFMVKLLRREGTPSAIAEAITQPEHFRKVQAALRRASNLSKRAPAPEARRAVNTDFPDASPLRVKPVEYKETWDKVRGNWLAKQLDPEKDLDKMPLIRMLKDQKGREMVKAATTASEFTGLVKLANAIEHMGKLKTPTNNMMAWRQTGAMMQPISAAGAAGTGAALGAGGLGLGLGAGILIVPPLMAQLLTRPAGRTLLTQMTKTPVTSSEAPGLALRFNELVQEVMGEMSEEERQQVLAAQPGNRPQ